MAILSGKVLSAALLKTVADVERGLPVAAEEGAADLAAAVVVGARTRGAVLGSVHGHVTSGINRAGPRTVELNVLSWPMIMGAEFGGGRRPTTQQFPPWRGTGDSAGYMVYPAIRAESTDEGLQKHIGGAIEARFKGLFTR